MPKCRHKEVQCVLGDFWVCKTRGCKNGPDTPTTPTGDGSLVARWRTIEWDDAEKTDPLFYGFEAWRAV